MRRINELLLFCLAFAAVASVKLGCGFMEATPAILRSAADVLDEVRCLDAPTASAARICVMRVRGVSQAEGEARAVRVYCDSRIEDRERNESAGDVADRRDR